MSSNAMNFQPVDRISPTGVTQQARDAEAIADADVPLRCRSGFATPTETFEDFNGFQNVSDGVANPVTLQVTRQSRDTAVTADADVGLRYANQTYAAELENTTLGEICFSQGGAINTGPFGSQLHTSDYKEQGIPVVMPTNIGEGGIVEDQIARISEDDAQRLGRHRLNVGDIVFSRRGDVTKNALIRSQEAGWLCGTGCLKVALGTQTRADARFISYYLRLPEIKNWLIRHAVGATMPNLNTGILSAVPVVLPPIPEQLDIAETLGALDDRIALLRETNTTLEAIVQALFKSWVVDFDPVHAKQQDCEPEGMDAVTAALFPDSFEASELGLVPKGWRVGNLGDEVSIAYGKNLPTKNLLESGFPVFGGNGQIGHFDKYLYEDRQVLVSCRGAASGKVNQSLPKSFVTNNSLILETDKGSDLEFCYLKGYLLKSDLSQFVTGSAQPQVTIDNLKKFKILVPPTSIVREYQNMGVTIEEKIGSNQKQAQTLATLRDTLLPRLISGQLRLPEAVGRVSLQGVTRQIEANRSGNT